MSVKRVERRLYFDIDKTLVDTAKIKTRLVAAIANTCGVESSAAAALLQGYCDTLRESTEFDPKELAEYCVKHLRGTVAVKKIEFALLDPAIFADTGYKDASILTRISLIFFAKGLRLGTYSQGVRYWQELKLLHSGIPYALFDSDLEEIHPQKTAKSVIDSIPAGSAIVDDREGMLAPLAERGDLHPIWINRDGNEKSKITGVKTIHSLRKLPALLKRLWLGPKQATQREQQC